MIISRYGMIALNLEHYYMYFKYEISIQELQTLLFGDNFIYDGL